MQYRVNETYGLPTVLKTLRGYVYGKFTRGAFVSKGKGQKVTVCGVRPYRTKQQL